MKKRILQTIMVSLLVCAMTVTPVLGASLEDLQADKARAEDEADALQAQLSETLNKIDTLEADIAQKEEDVAAAGDELERAAAKQDAQNKAMRIRIKYMYEEGNTSFFEALLSAKSFSDLLNKAEYIQEVHSYDRKKLTEYMETTKQVKQMKENLQEEYESMQTMQGELLQEKASLNATIAEKESEIASLDESIRDAIAARQEAERRAAEEAARAAAEQERQRQEQEDQQSEDVDEDDGEEDEQDQEYEPGDEDVDEGDSSQDEDDNSDDGGSSSYYPPQGTDGWAVVEYARQFIGNPYVWGGNSLTEGCDCSGFTMLIYAAFGVSLPRTDSDQAYCGFEVPLSEAQAGDLLCYYGHVGIYNGSGGIIHASAPGVGIVEWGNCQYRTIMSVRRVL